MKIKIKFSIGQKVWICHTNSNGSYVKCGIIFAFTIYKYKDEPICIEYAIAGKFEDLNYSEEDCFATQAEAQAECDRRNNGNNN